MVKIAIIGAGGFVFPLTLIRDILAFPELRDSTLALMDIDAARLGNTVAAASTLVERHGLPTRIEPTTSQRDAIRDADYVIVTFQVGGLDAYKLDVEIPRRYGLDQTVGDTLGPGGVFRALRSIPVYLDICRDMQELARPRALLINYANPMAMNCWAISSTGTSHVGLCHSVQGTSRMLAEAVGAPYDEVSYKSAGINHQAWFLELKRNGADIYPQVREAMLLRHIAEFDPSREGPLYEGANERVRTEIMRAFGYFHTESSHHASEYTPWFRKNPETVNSFIPRRWDYYEICSSHDFEDRTERIISQGLTPSYEYGAFIIHSMETGEPRVIYGNVPNRGLISNLPEGCCVEVPCLVDKNGIQPTAIGDLPAQCAALNRTNVNVQELAVKGALSGDRELVHAAIAIDPLTGALLTLEQIREMVDELFAAEERWLPQFN
jgi:alpha-galactosidase